MKERLQGIAAGILIGAIGVGGAVYAASGSQMIEAVYDNIKVYKDNAAVDLRDANDAIVEPFIYNGTTYLPVRAAANLANMDVTWDGDTKSVKLWDKTHPDNTFLMDVCEPYESSGFKAYTSTNGKSFEMAGDKYTNGFTLSSSGKALFNLKNKYSSMEFNVGHAESGSYEKTIEFIVDDKVVKEITLEANCMPRTYTIPLNYGTQLKVLGKSLIGYTGVGNIIVK